MHSILIDLIDSHRTETGVPTPVYFATYRLISMIFCQRSAEHFSIYIKAIEGVSYLRDSSPDSQQFLRNFLDIADSES